MDVTHRAQEQAGAQLPKRPGFDWRQEAWGWRLRSERLADHCAHGWSTRSLELGAGDDPRGWDRLSEALGLTNGALHRLRQVHGVKVHVAAGACFQSRPQADLAIASDPEVTVAVQVADCAAILMVDRRTGAVAAAHAGWRGSAAGVARHAVAAMQEVLGSRPSDLSAALGPSIGPCCYEVGSGLAQAFRDGGWDAGHLARWFSRRGDSTYLDLWQANADQLAAAGVPPHEIAVSRLCTSCHPEWFFSYRRDGAGTGRLAGFIRPADGAGRRPAKV